MDLGIRQRRAAVAAASAGLGFAAARALADEGVRVAICGRTADKVERAVAALGEGAVGVVADVGTERGARGFVREAAERLGGLDILVTNAGGPPSGTFETTPITAYEEAFHLNVASTIAMCKEAVPAMRAQGWGRVVAITSIGARQPIPTLIASVTARTAVTGFCKVLALEVARDGVTVNTVQPGTHATERMDELGIDLVEAASQIPVGFVGEPHDFGSVVAFLCSAQARFITGTSVLVDGGANRGLQ
jgi:3-oxoacyl-[acyl-carrier protein] reductase